MNKNGRSPTNGLQSITNFSIFSPCRFTSSLKFKRTSDPSFQRFKFHISINSEISVHLETKQLLLTQKTLRTAKHRLTRNNPWLKRKLLTTNANLLQRRQSVLSSKTSKCRSFQKSSWRQTWILWLLWVINLWRLLSSDL